MRNVVAFPARPRAAPQCDEARQRDAQILFFLGVRYVRTDEDFADRQTQSKPEASGARPAGGKRKRRVPA